MIPGFASAERAHENRTPPDDDMCEDFTCDECTQCLAALAQDEADSYAEQQREDARDERWWG